MLIGEKINLRLVTENDLSTLFSALANVSNRGDYFPLTLTPEPEFKKQFYEHGFWSEHFGRFLIVDKKDVMVGLISYYKTVMYSDALELAYIIYHPEQRRKGYTSEALKLFVDYLFSTKTMNRIQLGVLLENNASKKTALKAGFTLEGKRRQMIYHRGKHKDMEEFVLLREDWENERKRSDKKGIF